MALDRQRVLSVKSTGKAPKTLLIEHDYSATVAPELSRGNAR